MLNLQFLSNSPNLKLSSSGIFVRALPGLVEGLVYGPYVTLPQGHYSVIWKIDTTPGQFGVDVSRPAFKLDVVSDGGKTILSQKSVSLSEIDELDGLVQIDFIVPPSGAEKLEFRAFSHGVGDFLVGMYPQVHGEENQPIFAGGNLFDKIEDEASASSVSDFVCSNFSKFSELRRWGAVLSINAAGICASYKGIHVFIRNKEDFQIFGEVFVLSSYLAEFPRGFVVADVGMNVGFASLNFASFEGVSEVHAFEPFAPPFERALENFSLNPSLEAKIKPYNFGLYDSNSTNKVAYNVQNSIGTSVRGSGGGGEVLIELREAAAILEPIIRDTQRRGLCFLLKLDCEGSEFPIFASLEKANLLKDIDVILMEWHKWWDRTKTQRDLIEPLLASGFVVMDRTKDNDPHAGFISAVRLANRH